MKTFKTYVLSLFSVKGYNAARCVPIMFQITAHYTGVF